MSNIDLLSLKAGDIFEVKNVEYIMLEQLAHNRTAIIRKELLKKYMKFGNDNNWKTSCIRDFLNKAYLDEIESVFGENRIVEHTVDLLSLDGLDDYGTSTDKISLLTIDQYRKYKKELGGNLYSNWCLITPDTTSNHTDPFILYIRAVYGDVDVEYCDCIFGVRPFFIIQS